MKTIEEIQKFYDIETKGKIRDFVEGNPRVESAFNTILKWGGSPNNILEIGCGIGYNAFYMKEVWSDAKIIGFDISPKSIEMANALFSNNQITYMQGLFTQTAFGKKFDLIILMDVYEHIADKERLDFDNKLNELLAENGRIILTFPTPKLQSFGWKENPSAMQPVDEDITLEKIQKLASITSTDILLYKKVNIWHNGDYAHAVLGKGDAWEKIENPILHFNRPPRDKRIDILKSKMNYEYYSK